MKYTGPKAAAPAPNSVVDAELVETLARILTRLGLSEIEIAQGDTKIRVARQITAAPAPAPALPASAAGSPSAAAEADAPGAVKSPMVGTAYLRASPEAPPFVEIGSVVKAGDKLLLVEAMKTFNEIVAPVAGTVTSILVEDGQPVEYGQPLFVIE
ncbi:acetyl-CoA carboxylase biotin carboxyl carrier protein [Methylocella sp.]|jgi:acetyl-CoA carboxylase biotin carboxyl carrier protein|uniref:acetyl-CoA carboxylase biotin carboxyl carrier protein n=1 Tax=Methylocella sp. TaxID=1978226 RepID=UPI003C20B9CF